MKVAIIGAGSLGQSIANGLLKNNVVSTLYLTKRNTESLSNFSKYKEVTLTTDNAQAIKNADILIFAVQPRHLEQLLIAVKPLLQNRHTLISVITGFSIIKIEAIVGAETTIIRAMPNTAASVGQSMTCLSANLKGKERIALASTIFDSLGVSMVIPEEQLQAATVICASGIAFWMRLIRATTQGAIQLGFEAHEAHKLAMQTCFGAATLLKESGNHPEAEIDRVTTPGGCTIEGLNEMEHQGLSSSLIKGINKSFDKINQIKIKHMALFNVYPLYDVTPVSAKGVYVYDENNTEYLDLYGGHAVISIGHGHPKYVAAITAQVAKLGFYSNAIHNPLQVALSNKLETLSKCKDYELFLCSSGAEANENALKLASFQTNKSRVIAFKNGFHGRTSAAVAATDNKKIIAPINAQQKVTILELNDLERVKTELEKGDVCAVILEFIQGVGGLDQATASFFEQVDLLCKANNTMFIADEVQSGYGRSGKFFAFQHYNVTPDIISIAKGMGNGFPIGGILIHPNIKAKYGMLGTTFGGNHLACAAGLAVLNVIEEEELMTNVNAMSTYFTTIAATIPEVKKIKGKGLMLGLEFDFEVSELRKKLIYEYQIFTGGAANKKVLRILPPLNVNKDHINQFFEALVDALAQETK